MVVSVAGGLTDHIWEMDELCDAAMDQSRCCESRPLAGGFFMRG